MKLIPEFCTSPSSAPSGAGGRSPNPSSKFQSGISPERPGRRAVVLVVDDDPVMNRLVQRSLEGTCEVRQEFGLPQPGMLELRGVDLVVLDYQMPVRDGLEVLDEIRSEFPKVPVLFLTGFDAPELAERALRGGASAFLAKPVEAEVLKRTVERLLDGAGPEIPGDGVFRERSERSAGALPEMEQSREFRAIASDGRIVEGELVRFSPRSAVVEVQEEQGEQALTLGEQMGDLRLKYGRQQLRSSRAVVARVSRLSPTRWEFEARITGLWSVREDESTESSGSDASGTVSGSSGPAEEGWALSDWRRELPSAFRLATHELAGFLEEVQECCAAAESELTGGEGGLERFREESRFVLTTSERYSGDFWEVMSAFETACAGIVGEGGDGLASAKGFARRELYPSMLSSPFLARIVERPIGVPGDYGMLGQILGNPHEGYSLYDRVLNSWILKSGAADAYRYRVALLEREIRRSVARCRDLTGRGGRAASILSMASGVAYEVQHYIREPESEGEADFTLIDFSLDTLEEGRRQFEAHGSLPGGVTLQLYQSSVIDLANRSRGLGGEGDLGFSPRREDYDHVYCAGLYDYLSDRLVKRVSSYLYGLLRPGGTLALSNYTPGNPLKGLMTVVLDWELVYRDRESFAELVRDALPEGARLEIELDGVGAEVYALATRPEAG